MSHNLHWVLGKKLWIKTNPGIITLNLYLFSKLHFARSLGIFILYKFPILVKKCPFLETVKSGPWCAYFDINGINNPWNFRKANWWHSWQMFYLFIIIELFTHPCTMYPLTDFSCEQMFTQKYLWRPLEGRILAGSGF